eukprot:273926-Prorocentrum_minimum.AAC.1
MRIYPRFLCPIGTYRPPGGGGGADGGVRAAAESAPSQLAAAGRPAVAGAEGVHGGRRAVRDPGPLPRPEAGNNG